MIKVLKATMVANRLAMRHAESEMTDLYIVGEKLIGFSTAVYRRMIK
jgi:hypothetical protein